MAATLTTAGTSGIVEFVDGASVAMPPFGVGFAAGAACFNVELSANACAALVCDPCRPLEWPPLCALGSLILKVPMAGEENGLETLPSVACMLCFVSEEFRIIFHNMTNRFFAGAGPGAVFRLRFSSVPGVGLPGGCF
jgi:hypothetical protein